MSRGVIIIAAAALLIGLYLIFTTLTRDEDTAIRELVARMEAQAEARDWVGFMKNFSKDYKDSGPYSYMEILGIVKSTFEQVSEIDVTLEKLDVSVYGEKAEFSCKVYAIARQRDKIVYPFGLEGDSERPRVTLKKEGGDWKITRVEGVESGGL